MKLILYNITDSFNTLGKTLENGLELDIRLKKDFNFKNPFLRISIEHSGLFPYNYFTIPNLNKFYFIELTNFLSGNIFEIYARIDLLETYKQDILHSINSFYGEYLIDSDAKAKDFSYTGNKEIITINSNIELEKGRTMILSVIGG